MQGNIKFDHNPYIMENKSSKDILEINNSIIKLLLKEEAKVFNTRDRKFSILSKNASVDVKDHVLGAKYSFIFFNIKKEVSFIDYTHLSPSDKERLKEEKLGYILIVNIGNYIFITRRNTANIYTTKFDGISKLHQDKVDNYMSRYDTVKSVVLRSLENKEKGILSKQYGGNDIKDSLAGMNTSDSFLANMVLGDYNDPKSTTSFNQSTGLFTFSSSLINGKTLDHIVEYYNQLILLFDDLTGKKSLHYELGDKFFKEVNFEDVNTDEMHSLMFSLQDIEELAHESGLDDSEIDNILSYLSEYYELINGNYENSYLIININIESNRIKLRIIFKDCVEFDADTYDSLMYIINTGKLFTINFISDDNIVFYNGRLYTQPQSDIDIGNVFNVFQEQAYLDKLISEKGKKGDYPSLSNDDWSDNSIFYGVEQYFVEDSNNLVICGDLGKEIADHIIFNQEENKITLIHSKGRTKENSSYGVSQFQEIVGQATKNIEGFNINNTTIFNKIIGLVKSNINCPISLGAKTVSKSRIISNHSEEEAVSIIEYFQGRPNVTNELILCINFFDKEGLEDNMIGGDEFLLQQFKNIIGRLMHTCSEKGMKYYVHYPESIEGES